MAQKEKSPLPITGTDAQRAGDFLRKEGKKQFDFAEEKLQELASDLSDHNLFPKKDFIFYPNKGIKGYKETKKRLLPVFDENQTEVVLTPKGQLLRVQVGVNRSFYFSRYKLEYLEGDEFIHFTGIAFERIAEVVNQACQPTPLPGTTT